MPIGYLLPLFVGIIIMLMGIAVNTVFPTLPTDTLGCALNAICIYYAFYKKRFYALSQITSRGSMYVVSILLTGIAISALYRSWDYGVQKHSGEIWENSRLPVMVICPFLEKYLASGGQVGAG